jgi:hypothetical protein
MEFLTRNGIATALAGAVVSALFACAPAASSTGGDTAPEPTPSESTPTMPTTRWPVGVRQHVDLWLHGFALLQADTTLVPFFRRGYRQTLTDARSRANAVTMLDANRDKLTSHITANPKMVNAQFVAMYFANWNDMKQTVDFFLEAGGNPRNANTRELASAVSLLAGYFPTAPDRDWLRLYMQSLGDENTKFFQAYWTQEQVRRQPVRNAFESLWRDTYQTKFTGILRNSRMERGTVLLSIPLNGEGRTLTGSAGEATIAVTYPDEAIDAIYVVAHESVANVVMEAIRDNTTPSEQREGAGDRYVSPAAVRAGAMLLERIAPDLVDGYMRYYLTTANRSGSSNIRQIFESVFAIPEGIRAGIAKQLDLVLGGI